MKPKVYSFAPATRLAVRLTGLRNLFRMGHCAPAVMQSLLDISQQDGEWPVKFSSGMPGGIGNTGFECGAVTSPLVQLGLRYGLRDVNEGLPIIFDKGYGLCRRFVECHRTMMCREIRGQDRFPRHCIRPVVLSPELYGEATTAHGQPAIPPEIRAGYGRLYAHMAEHRFHCARAVFDRLPCPEPDHATVADAASAFMGGTLFMGLTCSAYTAGVMALGLRYGEIENSYPRVLRMIVVMTMGGNAFDEKLNKFNRSMNRGQCLSRWFTEEFGSTQCRAITQCDFATPSGVSRYVESGCVSKCKRIAEKVAGRVAEMLAEPEVALSEKEAAR